MKTYRYSVYSIPFEMRGSEYLSLLQKSIEGDMLDGSSFKVKRFSWKDLLLKPCPADERRVIQIHWETNIYGSEYLFVSIVRMLYRFPGLLLARMRGARIFWTIHNLRAHDYPHPWIDALGRAIMWRIVDAVQIQQKSFADEMKRANKHPAIWYIPHPNFVGVFGPVWDGDRDELRAEYGIEKNTKALLAFGSVRPYKELPKLMDAVVDARKKGADVCLLIAGRGSKEYEAVIREKAEGHPEIILRLSFVENSDVSNYMAAADYTAQYYSESSLNSGPLLVSLSYGVPVITRDMPAAEIIADGQNGFVFTDKEELDRILLGLGSVHLARGDDIIRTSGPSWPAMAAELRAAYASMWRPYQ